MVKMHYVFSARVFGAILVAKIGSKHLFPGPKSSIIITSGSIAEKPIAGGWATLAFVGAGICGLARQLAFDLAPLRVNALAPGVTDTNLWADMPKEVLDLFVKAQRENVLTGEVRRAEDMAEAYIYLMKDRNATGLWCIPAVEICAWHEDYALRRMVVGSSYEMSGKDDSVAAFVQRRTNSQGKSCHL